MSFSVSGSGGGAVGESGFGTEVKFLVDAAAFGVAELLGELEVAEDAEDAVVGSIRGAGGGKDLLKLGYVYALDGGGGKSEDREHSEENEPAHLNLPRGSGGVQGRDWDGREACIELYTDGCIPDKRIAQWYGGNAEVVRWEEIAD